MYKKGRVQGRKLQKIVAALYIDSSQTNRQKIADEYGISVHFVNRIANGSFPTIHRGKIRSKGLK